MRAESPVPVTTGEIWSTWLEHPELAANVDFIAAHILSYWEGVPREQAVQTAVDVYDRMRAAFPGKHIVVAEFGWPSGGYNMKGAEPAPWLRPKSCATSSTAPATTAWTTTSSRAFDQVWKTNEGSVGAYWGLFNADRKLKFDLAGAIREPNKERIVGAALLVGTLLSLIAFALRRPTFWHALMVAGAAQAVGAWLAVTIAHPAVPLSGGRSAVMWVAGLILLVPLALLSLARIEEIAAIALGRGPTRLLPERIEPEAFGPVPEGSLEALGLTERPKVSIHTRPIASRRRC